MLKNFYVGVDSTIALFWTFKPDIRKKGILVENRNNNIKQCLNQAYSYLIEQHKHQNIDSAISKDTPLENSFEKVLLHVPGEMNPSDIGTRQQTFSDQHRHKMLSFTDCGPTSVMYNDMPWMRNFDKFLANKTIIHERNTNQLYTKPRGEKGI